MNYHKHKYSLEYRPFIGWKESCLKKKESTPNKVESLYDGINKIRENKDKLKFLNVIFTGIILCIILVYFPLKCDINDIWHYVYQIITFLLYIIFAVPLMFNNIFICWNLLYNEREYINIYQCSDHHTNTKLLQIKNNLKFIFYMDFSLFWLTLLALTIPVLLISCINIDEKEKE